MDDRVCGDVEEGKGMEFGTRVHDFPEQYAEGESIKTANDDEHNVKAFLDSLAGELRAEENAYLPVAVGDDQVTISEVIDLLHITEDRVDIVDYKTDRCRHAESEYRKQLSVYYHVVRHAYPERGITASIFYTADGTRVDIDPLTVGEISDLVELTDRGRRDGVGENPQIR